MPGSAPNTYLPRDGCRTILPGPSVSTNWRTMMRRTLVLAMVGAFAPLVFTAPPAGAAAPLCFGMTATILGTEGPDTLIGQSGVSDVIWGAGGDDVISGGDFYGDDAVGGRAPDLLCGGPGNDRVGGSPGNDKINGGDGNDHVDGRSGSDLVQGNAGNDVVRDESFQDADSGDDVLKGGTGDDRITIAWGIDRAYGDAGNDEILDLECSKSYLYGGPGADTFESYWSSFEAQHCDVFGAVADVINGNDGADRAEVSRSDSVTGVELVTRIKP